MQAEGQKLLTGLCQKKENNNNKKKKLKKKNHS